MKSTFDKSTNSIATNVVAAGTTAVRTATPHNSEIVESASGTTLTARTYVRGWVFQILSTLHMSMSNKNQVPSFVDRHIMLGSPYEFDRIHFGELWSCSTQGAGLNFFSRPILLDYGTSKLCWPTLPSTKGDKTSSKYRWYDTDVCSNWWLPCTGLVWGHLEFRHWCAFWAHRSSIVAFQAYSRVSTALSYANHAQCWYYSFCQRYARYTCTFMS